MVIAFKSEYNAQDVLNRSYLHTRTNKCKITAESFRNRDGVFRAHIYLSTLEHTVRFFLKSVSMKPKDLDECLFLILKDWKNESFQYEMDEDIREYLHAPTLYRVFCNEDTESVLFLNGELCGDILREDKQNER